MELYTLHLFAGAGGGILADKLLGFRTIGAVEIDEYCRRVLLNRQFDGCLDRFPIWDDVVTFRADNPATKCYIERLRGIRNRLCISGGFPCQDISAAGRGAGINGERSGLWKEFARIIGEIRPAFAFVENSNQLVRRGIDVVLGDLDELGYDVAWGVFSAANVGAPHLRKRFWGLAVNRNIPDANSQRGEEFRDRITIETENNRHYQLLRDLSDTLLSRNERWNLCAGKNLAAQTLDNRREKDAPEWQRRQIEPRLGGMVDGLETWLDEVATGRFWDVTEHNIPRLLDECENRRKRLKALGNGQVPLCAAVAFVTLLNQYLTFTRRLKHV